LVVAEEPKGDTQVAAPKPRRRKSPQQNGVRERAFGSLKYEHYAPTAGRASLRVRSELAVPPRPC